MVRYILEFTRERQEEGGNQKFKEHESGLLHAAIQKSLVYLIIDFNR